MPLNKSTLIKTIYFYLVSLIALLMVVFSTADLINLGLKTWVFPKTNTQYYGPMTCAIPQPVPTDGKPVPTSTQQDYQKQCEQDRKNQEEAAIIQNQRDAVRDTSMIVVGIPLFLYHWITLRKEQKADREA
jgi:hypothetical protein